MFVYSKLTLEQMMLFVNFVVIISASGVISHMDENASLVWKRKLLI